MDACELCAEKKRHEFMKVSSLVLGFLWAVALTSYRIDAATPSAPESSVFYTNYVMPRVPWSIHVARTSRADHDLEIHSTHARGCALGLATLTDQINSINPHLGTPVA